jgi:hypothetical protein
MNINGPAKSLQRPRMLVRHVCIELAHRPRASLACVGASPHRCTGTARLPVTGLTSTSGSGTRGYALPGKHPPSSSAAVPAPASPDAHTGSFGGSVLRIVLCIRLAPTAPLDSAQSMARRHPQVSRLENAWHTAANPCPGHRRCHQHRHCHQHPHCHQWIFQMRLCLWRCPRRCHRRSH